jgi:hypothetical protein
MGVLRTEGAMRVGAVVMLAACCAPPANAGESSERYCGSSRYAAASAESSGGPRLWVVDLEAEEPRVRVVALERLPRELVCGIDAVYLRGDATTSVVELEKEPLAPVSGANWQGVERPKGHLGGRLRAGRVYELPDPAFVFALTKARRGHGDTLDETRALFLVGPKRETLIFSVRHMVVVVQ